MACGCAHDFVAALANYTRQAHRSNCIGAGCGAWAWCPARMLRRSTPVAYPNREPVRASLSRLEQSRWVMRIALP